MTGPAAWMTYRSLTQDPSVKGKKLNRATLRRVMQYAIPYKRALVIFLTTVILEALLVTATPLLLRNLIDHGVIPGNSKVVTYLALAVGGLALADTGINLIGRWFSSRIGEGLIYDLRTQVFTHVQSQPISFFVRTQTGSLISRLNTDVIGAQQAFTATLSGLLSNILTLIMVVITMLYLSWVVTILALVLVPLFLIPTRALGRRLQKMTRQTMNLNADMSSVMSERFNVSGALLVKLFGSAENESRLFSGKARLVADTGIRIALLNRIFFTSLMLITSVATALVYGVGGHLAINKTITLGTLLALTALLARLYGPLTALSNVRVDVMTAIVSFERVFEVLDLQPAISDSPNAQEVPAGPLSLQFENVTFSYAHKGEETLESLELVKKSEPGPAINILRNINFKVDAGQMTALVGASGAGKTTISHLIPRLYDVSEGRVLINGIDIRNYSLQSLRSRIGVVSQDPHLFHDSLLENLKYAKPSATLSEIESACRLAQIWNLINSLPEGLSTRVGERGYRLSGGEKQRVAIARLLLKDPDIVILDEATAHLDSENEAEVQAALSEALKNRTSIVIAHRLSTVKNANEIIVLADGEISDRGSHDQLMARPGLYRDLFERQSLSSFN
jgi:ATP-binding cassette subfamily B protein